MINQFYIFILCIMLSPQAHSDKIKVGSSPALSSAGIYLAEELGFFKTEGLDVEVLDFATSGAPMTLLLSKGQLDVGAGNLTSGIFNAIISGQGFKIVADKGHVEKSKQYMHLLVRKDLLDSGRYKTLADLKGFRIGLTALDGVSQQVVVDRFLKKNGIKESEVEYIKMSYAEMNIALKTKNIDAAIQLEPFLTKALMEGYAKSVASSWDVHPAQQSAALFYSPHFLNNKKGASKFMVGYLKGVKAYNEAIQGKNKGAEAALKKIFKIEDSIWLQLKPVGLYEDGHLNEAALFEDIKWYREHGFISKELKREDVIDDSFVKAASKTLKK